MEPKPQTSLSIRPGVAADAAALCRVHFEAVRGIAPAFYPPEVIAGWATPPSSTRNEQFRRAIADGVELFLVADAGEVVGFGSILGPAKELRSLYVHPQHGRRGLGGELLRELERLALAQGLESLQLTGSLNAEAFYLRHGYQVYERATHHASTGLALACVKMRKALRPASAT